MIEKVISNDYDISDISLWFKFFANMFPNFKIMASANCETTIEYKTENPIQKAINKFKNHPSIQMLRSKLNLNKIYFCTNLHNEILKQIENLDTKRPIKQNYILQKLSKENSYFF